MSSHPSPSPSARHPTISPGRKQSPATQQQQTQAQTQQNSQNASNQLSPQDLLINNIKKINKPDCKDRSQAIQTLVTNRGSIPDLALMLWFSPATATSLLTDVLNFYPHLVATRTSSPSAQNAYNALILLQVIADHEDTRLPFVRANIPIYLIPIIHHTLMNSETEYITGVVISIIASLVKESQSEIIESLLNADFLSTCLRVLSVSRGIIRTATSFILNQILSNNKGKDFVLEKTDRTQAIIKVLNQILTELGTEFEQQLSKNVVETYRRLLPAQSVSAMAGELMSEELRSMQIHMSCDAQYRDLVGQLRNLVGRKR